MEIMFAYCGLDCESCLIHLASAEQDKSKQQEMRTSIAEQCAHLYGLDLQPEDINDCDGCRANTRILFSACLSCEIRNCARRKEIGSCAFCSDYPCATLLKHFSLDPQAQGRLEEIRKTI